VGVQMLLEFYSLKVETVVVVLAERRERGGVEVLAVPVSGGNEVSGQDDVRCRCCSTFESARQQPHLGLS